MNKKIKKLMAKIMLLTTLVSLITINTDIRSASGATGSPKKYGDHSMKPLAVGYFNDNGTLSEAALGNDLRDSMEYPDRDGKILWNVNFATLSGNVSFYTNNSLGRSNSYKDYDGLYNNANSFVLMDCNTGYEYFMRMLLWLSRGTTGKELSDDLDNYLTTGTYSSDVGNAMRKTGYVDLENTFGVSYSDTRGPFDSVFEFIGDVSKISNIYSVKIKDKAQGKSSIYWYVGCDYNTDTNDFIYYIVAATAVGGANDNADDLMVSLFKCKDYINFGPDILLGGLSNIEGTDSTVELEDITAIVKSGSYNNTHTFPGNDNMQEHFENAVASTLIDTVLKDLKSIESENNEVSSVYSLLDGSDEVKTAIKKIEDFLDFDIDGTKMTLKLSCQYELEFRVRDDESIPLQGIGVDSYRNNHTLLTSSRDIDTSNSEAIDFGNKASLVSKDIFEIINYGETSSVDALTDFVLDCVADCTNAAQKKAQNPDGSFSDIESVMETIAITLSGEEYLNFHESESSTIARVLSGITSTLSESLQMMNVNKLLDGIKSPSSIDFYNSDNYNILRDIIIYNYKCIHEKSDFQWDFARGSSFILHVDKNYVNGVYSGPSLGNIELRTMDYYWSTLTSWEKLVLSTEYANKIDEKGYKNNPSVISWLYKYRDDAKGIGSNQTVNVHLQFTPIQFENAKSLVKEYENSTYTNFGSPLTIARQANVTSQYLVAKYLYSTQGNTDELFNLFNANLDTLVSTNFKHSTATDNYYPELPRYLSFIESNSVQGEELINNCYLDLGSEGVTNLLNLLWNIDFAFQAMNGSVYGLQEGYAAEDIESWFSVNNSDEVNKLFEWLRYSSKASAWESDPAKAKEIDFNNNAFTKDLFLSVVELYDMCEFFGISSWNAEIDEYLKIYRDNKEFFDYLRANTTLYGRANTGEITKEEPLGKFFSIAENKVSDQWAKGFSLSALYVPMETNVYDASSIRFVEDSDWVPEFYYKYGFFRKALYINTDNSALINQFVSGQKSGTRVATLRDLLNYERDIVLTVDPNFYNADEINSVVSKLDYTNVRNSASAEDTSMGWESVGNWIGELFDLSPSQVLKTAGNYYYSEALQEGVTKLDASLEEEEENYKTSMLDAYLLNNIQILGDSTAEVPIESAIDADEYSVKQSYAVVSAVYRCNELYNLLLSGIASDNAIFKSSKGVCSVPGTSSNDWRAVLNYAMLANLEEQMKNDSATAIDLDSPIFCDVFGNILTESGLVIVPAACNATLCGQSWNPYTIGWSEYYNNGNRIKVEELPDDVYSWLIGKDYEKALANESLSSEEAKKENGGGYFEISKNGDLILRTTALTSNNLSAIVTWSNLNKNSDVISNLFFSDAYFSKTPNLFGPRLANMIVEVLRGAPIENIDYSFEGLSGKVDISKYGVFMAYKLEEIVDSVISGTNGNAFAGSGNSMVTMPNLAFVSGIEYIVLYVFKIVFAVFIVGLVISLYLDAVKNHLGIKSVGKFIVTCVMTIVSLTLVPNLISWSYYEANKSLLSDEVSYIMMLNYVKEFDGAEIGITSVRTPETETELFIRVEDVSVDWWDIIDDVLFNNSINTVTDLYESQLTDSSMAHVDKVQHKADGLYVDVNDVFNSTSIVYKPSSHVLENQIYNITYNKESGVSGANTMGLSSAVSFTSPYYVFLDQLIANVNEYNITGDVQSYSYSVGSNGHIMTYDIISPYLTSEEYLAEGYDILGLHKILNTTHKPLLYNFAFNQSDVDSMHRSSWWPGDNMPTEVVEDKVSELYAYARDFINMNQNVLGKVPDEVFLKVLALQLATKYNDLFGVTNSNAIEIINIDSRDLMRFLVADKGDIYKYYSYSFSRFVYEEAGGFGTVIMMFYTVVLWLTSMLKPILMVLLVALLIINVVGRKVLFRKESRCIEGYLIGAACLCLCNYAYAIMLKATMQLMSLGLGSTLTMLTAFVVQIAYVCGLIGICRIEVKDWKNNGFSEWQHIGGRISSGILHAQQLMAEKVVSRSNEAYRDSLNRNVPSPVIEHLRVADMIEREMQRVENGTYSTD